MGEFKPVVGAEVILDPYGNARRGGAPVRGHITRIGRKYFYVQVGFGRSSEYPFDIKTCKFVDLGDWNGGYNLYPTMEDYDLEQERQQMIRDLRKHFDSFKVSDSFEAIKTAYNAIFGLTGKENGNG